MEGKAAQIQVQGRCQNGKQEHCMASSQSTR